MKSDFKKGLKLGIPIGMGYFSVSLAFGMMAINSGLSPLVAVLISMTNLTSAGQFAGVSLMAMGGSGVEMALTMLMINARYFLMSLALTQKFCKKFSFINKLIVGFGVTDEVFTLAAMEKGELSPAFLKGMIVLPYIGWSMGTLVGALMSNILPVLLQDALGVALYGMFIAIIVPAVRESREVFFTVSLAVVCSCILRYLPLFEGITSGFAIIICTLVGAGIAAAIYPIECEDKKECIS